MGAKQSVPKITEQDRAVLDLKLQRDKLKQYQKKIQTVLDREQEIAKQQLRAGQKDRAVVTLRRKKYQETLLSRTDAQLEQLEQLVSTIEFSLVQVSVMHGLKQGNDVLKEIHKEMSLEKVELLLEETAEAQAYQREINDMLSNNLSLDEEDAVQEELRRLQEETVRDTQPADSIELPAVPVSEPISKEPLAEEPTEEGSEFAVAETRTRVALAA